MTSGRALCGFVTFAKFATRPHPSPLSYQEGRHLDLVYIYGPPGTGKLTVGKALAQLTGYKLFHNHLSIDAVRPVFDYGTEPFWRQVHRIRQEMLEEAARCDVSLIYTSVYSHPKDRELAARR